MKINRPKHGEKVLYKSDFRLTPVAAWFNEVDSMFIGMNSITDPSCHIDNVLWWESLMKQNKYRWREMKNEKPKINELVILFSATDAYIPSFGNYKGTMENRKDILIFSRKPEETVVSLYSIEGLHWRKMCKLPGEK